jgi:DNA-binding HxlR family transcriptional regulator
MPNKTYGQVCPIARALDVLGDRWTLLVVRELLLGPKRFKDLLSMLPAMGTNRLSERLAMLVDNGVIRSTAPSYELTELGEQLRKPVIALGLWGLRLPADERIDPSNTRAELIALCLTGTTGPQFQADLRKVFEFQVGTEIFHIQIEGGQVLARSGPFSGIADVQVRCDLDAFVGLALRQVTTSDVLREGRASLQRGSRQAFSQIFKILEYRA